MNTFNAKVIEKKWQDYWEEHGTYRVDIDTERKKFYALVEFPYPSGEGLHTGHVRGYTAMDILARKRRMEGYNVLYPIGWDAFGLPTENYAIKTSIHPEQVTKKNTDTFRRQLQSLGFAFDWSREINTTDPEYYQWTQWIFLQLFKKGLAYKAKMEINWCPSCKIGLANEEAQGGVCERCGGPTEKREKEQWMLAITKYADRLDKDLDTVDYWDKIKVQQRNWIGRSEGAVVKFPIKSSASPQPSPQLRRGEKMQEFLEVFTTRVDTIFSGTFLILAPEHPLVKKLLKCHPALDAGSRLNLDSRVKPENDNSFVVENYEEIQHYIDSVKKKTEIERLDATREKTGVEVKGITVVNPANGDELPVWISDFVLGHYGTGAVFADAHDERDSIFAKKYGIPLKISIAPFFTQKEGKDAVRPDMPTVRRKTAFAFVKHWSEDKYLCLDWEKFGWHSGIIGGIEEGEDAVAAGLREIIEETGYQHPVFHQYVGGVMHANFYAVHKQVNRYADGIGMLFQLKDDAWEQPDEAKTVNHKAVWIDGSEMGTFLNLDNFVYMWEALRDGREYFTGEGVLVNSGQFDGLMSAEARPQIIAWLAERGLAETKVNFKLRDWVFSRQRYWGDPIPMVKCERCGVAEAETKLSVNFYDEAIWKRVLSGEKTIETRALNPEEPERYFGDVHVGDIVKFVLKKTGEEKLFRIKTVFNFAHVSELFEKKEIHGKIFAEQYTTLKSLEEGYDKLAPGYTDKINQNGLVGWEVEYVSAGKWVPLPEDELPLKLPKVETYTPTDTGESPLAGITEWVETTCPVCGGPATRETDTMPNWAGSSWYYLRYTDPKNSEALASREALEYFTPVDWYNGGMEHTTLHLLYSRFWHKFLFDIGVVPTSEPYQKRTSHGLILAEGGVKMSKSKGNVVNPDSVVAAYGADTLRVYEMFMGPFDQPVAWSMDSISGSRRFLDRVWKLQEKVAPTPQSQSTTPAPLGQRSGKCEILLHQTIKKVSEDIEAMRFNTAVSALMIFVNEAEKVATIEKDAYEKFLILLSPFAPHITEELWRVLGHTESIFVEATWPVADERFLKNDTVEIAVQVNGKLRASFAIATDADEATVRATAESDPRIAIYLTDKTIQKVIFVPNRLMNFVIS